MFPDQPIGLAIQLSVGQKNGAASTVHPISGSLACGLGRSGLIIASKASRDSAPFFSPNTSQASDKGSVENLTNVPPPAMWLCGRLSLNRKGAPDSSPTKGALSLGCQKLTSSTSARLRNSNQLLSVTPNHSLIEAPREGEHVPDCRTARSGVHASQALPSRNSLQAPKQRFAYYLKSGCLPAQCPDHGKPTRV